MRTLMPAESTKTNLIITICALADDTSNNAVDRTANLCGGARGERVLHRARDLVEIAGFTDELNRVGRAYPLA